MPQLRVCRVLLLLLPFLASFVAAAEVEPRVRRITSGPKHHFFGYIGHARTVPWNASGRYVLSLATSFQDRMPAPSDAADIVLLDAERDYAPTVVDQTRAWNFQQGTMFYWNLQAAETQFFFNDRDPRTQRVFTVLFDTVSFDTAQKPGGRRREFRFADASIANSGVSPVGGQFAAINYGRLARLRPVTGYAGAADPTEPVAHPMDDGVFVVDVESGAKRLLVSFKQLGDAIRPRRSDVDKIALFINHTLWSPDGKRLFFFCRGNFDDSKTRIDLPFVARADGSGLTLLADHFGGHPEWLDEHTMIGRQGKLQAAYDVDRQAFVRTFGAADTFPDPGGDVALSPDGRWLVNGSSAGAENRFTFHRLLDGLTLRAGPLPRGRFRSGDLRIDGGPAWNRSSSAILTTAIASDQAGTRQLFLIELPDNNSKTN